MLKEESSFELIKLAFKSMCTAPFWIFIVVGRFFGFLMVSDIV
jgi:hypothetical protein